MKKRSKKLFLGPFWKILTKKLRFFGARSPRKFYILAPKGRQGVESLKRKTSIPPPRPILNPPLLPIGLECNETWHSYRAIGIVTVSAVGRQGVESLKRKTWNPPPPPPPRPVLNPPLLPILLECNETWHSYRAIGIVTGSAGGRQWVGRGSNPWRRKRPSPPPHPIGIVTGSAGGRQWVGRGRIPEEENVHPPPPPPPPRRLLNPPLIPILLECNETWHSYRAIGIVTGLLRASKSTFQFLVTWQKIPCLKIPVNKIPFQILPRSKIAHYLRNHNKITKNLRNENKAVNRSR